MPNASSSTQFLWEPGLPRTQQLLDTKVDHNKVPWLSNTSLMPSQNQDVSKGHPTWARHLSSLLLSLGELSHGHPQSSWLWPSAYCKSDKEVSSSQQQGRLSQLLPRPVPWHYGLLLSPFLPLPELTALHLRAFSQSVWGPGGKCLGDTPGAIPSQ